MQAIERQSNNNRVICKVWRLTIQEHKNNKRKEQKHAKQTNDIRTHYSNLSKCLHTSQSV